jgi:hypothetical protein
MAQIALLSHISMLKYEQDKAQTQRERNEMERHGGRKKRFLNTTNEQAAALLMQGMAS